LQPAKLSYSDNQKKKKKKKISGSATVDICSAAFDINPHKLLAPITTMQKQKKKKKKKTIEAV
jgi:methylthioribose-1-phosphate isomerase